MKKKKQSRSVVNLLEAGRFASKNVNRISGKIARSLALNSPWIDILGELNMKKYKKTLILKNFDTCMLDSILFEKPIKNGCNSIRGRDIFPVSVRGSYKITVEFKPSNKRGKY